MDIHKMLHRILCRGERLYLSLPEENGEMEVKKLRNELITSIRYDKKSFVYRNRVEYNIKNLSLFISENNNIIDKEFGYEAIEFYGLPNRARNVGEEDIYYHYILFKLHINLYKLYNVDTNMYSLIYIDEELNIEEVDEEYLSKYIVDIIRDHSYQIIITKEIFFRNKEVIENNLNYNIFVISKVVEDILQDFNESIIVLEEEQLQKNFPQLKDSYCTMCNQEFEGELASHQENDCVNLTQSLFNSVKNSDY